MGRGGRSGDSLDQRTGSTELVRGGEVGSKGVPRHSKSLVEFLRRCCRAPWAIDEGVDSDLLRVDRPAGSSTARVTPLRPVCATSSQRVKERVTRGGGGGGGKGATTLPTRTLSTSPQIRGRAGQAGAAATGQTPPTTRAGPRFFCGLAGRGRQRDEVRRMKRGGGGEDTFRSRRLSPRRPAAQRTRAGIGWPGRTGGERVVRSLSRRPK